MGPGGAGVPSNSTSSTSSSPSLDGNSPGGNGTSNVTNGNAGCDQIGGGHGNPIHASRIADFIKKLIKSGKYAIVYGNRSLNTAGLVGNQRPDVIAVSHSGNYEIWEFASPSQTTGSAGYRVLQHKIDMMQDANPSVLFHTIIPW